MKIPTWEEIDAQMVAGTPPQSALERFIYEQEPAGEHGEEFQEVLQEVVTEVRAPGAKIAYFLRELLRIRCEAVREMKQIGMTSQDFITVEELCAEHVLNGARS